MNDHAADSRADAPLHDAEAQAESERGSDPESAQIEVLRAELDEANERLLRMAAELDNLRKRSQREIENAHRYGIERFAQTLLPVIDSFEAALNADNLELDSLLEGQRATLRLLEQAFEAAGIAPIDPVGEPFDPQQHEAMSMLAAPSAEPDSVIDVIQKGYSLDTRLLRPARVVVAKAPEESDR